MKRATLVALVFVTVLCAVPAFSQKTMYIQGLHNASALPQVVTPSGIPFGVGPPSFKRVTKAGCTDWWQATVNIYLKDPSGAARTAYITTEYQGTPSGWTVDIGDSATDNGYGGNDGSPEHSAEVQVVEQLLSVYNEDKGTGVDDMLHQQVSLMDGSLKFTIANQTLTVGQPRTILATPQTKTLFWIPDPLVADDNDPEKWAIHAAFNGVVRGDLDRQGCGVDNVVIWTGL